MAHYLVQRLHLHSLRKLFLSPYGTSGCERVKFIKYPPLKFPVTISKKKSFRGCFVPTIEAILE